MRTILLIFVAAAAFGCQANSQIVKQKDAGQKDAGQKDAGPPARDTSTKDVDVFDPTDDPNFVGC